MRAISSDQIESGRLATAFATLDPATGSPGNLSLDHDGANAGDLRPELERDIGVAFARLQGAFVRVLHRLRDARDRRQTVRELRRLSPVLLADIGIEPGEIEQVIDASVASHRHWAAMRSPGPRTRRR